jgi:DNA-binding transcriptional ArsR family regulator
VALPARVRVVKGRAQELAGLDREIHEPARLTIVAMLYAAEEADFVFLQRESGLTKGNLSSHLARLEQAGYVAIEKTFRGKIPLTVCRLTEAGRWAFERYRATLKRALG